MEFKKQTSLIPYFEGFRQQLFNSQVERLLMKKALNRGKKVCISVADAKITQE
jgi:hypothetical protein